MKIEVFRGIGVTPRSHRNSWYWHFKATNGKVTADSEAFPTKAHAVRAAKQVVRQVIKKHSSYPVAFWESKVTALNEVTITWNSTC